MSSEHKPLSAAEIEELRGVNTWLHDLAMASGKGTISNADARSVLRLTGGLTPPTDEAVREAGLTGPDLAERVRDENIQRWMKAEKSPRLTDAQVAALHIAQLRCLEEGNLSDVVEILESAFRAAFPETGE